MENIKTYRYMWLKDDSDKLNIRIVSGITEEHNRFIEDMKQCEGITHFTRVYVHEIDFTQIEYYENLIEEKEEENNA